MIRFAGISRRHTVLASVSSDMSDHEESLRVLLRQQGGAALKRQASFDAGVCVGPSRRLRSRGSDDRVAVPARNIFHLLTHNGIVYSCLVQRDARVRYAPAQAHPLVPPLIRLAPRARGTPAPRSSFLKL